MTSDRPADLEARVARLEALEAIRALVADYSFHIDHARFRDVAALFTDTCGVDFGIAPPVEGRSALEQLLVAASQPDDPAARMVATSHHNADVRVELDDDTRAHGTVSLYAWHAPATGGRAGTGFRTRATSPGSATRCSGCSSGRSSSRSSSRASSGSRGASGGAGGSLPRPRSRR